MDVMLEQPFTSTWARECRLRGMTTVLKPSSEIPSQNVKRRERRAVSPVSMRSPLSVTFPPVRFKDRKCFKCLNNQKGPHVSLYRPYFKLVRCLHVPKDCKRRSRWTP